MVIGQGSDSKISESTTGGSDKPAVVTSNQAKKPRYRFWRAKKLIVFIVFVLLLATAGVLGWRQYQNSRDPIVRYAQPTSVWAAQEAKKMKNNQPPGNASLQTKLAYYDTLSKTEALANNYKDAVKAYEARAKLSDRGLNYYDYYRVAQYYQQAGDKAGALKSLDKAQRTIPPDDPDNGFYRSDAQSSIDRFRQELSK